MVRFTRITGLWSIDMDFYEKMLSFLRGINNADMPEEKEPERESFTVPEISMAFKEAQKAGFQFKYGRYKENVIILSIHIRSAKTVIPAYIEGKPVTNICPHCRVIVDKNVGETAIYFPKTVTKIGERAFENRTLGKDGGYISEVYIAGEAYIGVNAFARQFKLRKLCFPQYTHIGEAAFLYCVSLESVDLRGTAVSNMSFMGCEKLTNVLLTGCITGKPFSGTPFEKSADMLIAGKRFIKCNLMQKEITVPDGIEFIGEGAFNGNKAVERVILPESVHEIEKDAFRQCTSLSEINLEKVKYIRDRAFAGCFKLDSRVIEKHLPHINGDPFSGTIIADEHKTPDGTVINGILTTGRPNTINGVWELNGGITEISWSVGDHCHFGDTAVIPESVRYMRMSGFSGFRRVIIKNPKTDIYFDRTPYFSGDMTHREEFCLSFETENGLSDFIMYFWETPMLDSARKQVITDFYNSLCSHYFSRFFAEMYDNGILDIGLSYRHMLDIAYRRVVGGYLLTEKKRRRYTEFLIAHRKKGLKYAEEENNREKADFLMGLTM